MNVADDGLQTGFQESTIFDGSPYLLHYPHPRADKNKHLLL